MNRELLDRIYQSNGKINDRLLCVFCDKLLLNPKQFECGHRSCQDCLESALQTEKPLCPQCGCTIDVVQSDYGVLKEISDLVVYCPMDSCAYKDRFAKLSLHLSNCSELGAIVKECKKSIPMRRSKKMDVNKEIIEMKRNIASLMVKNDQMQQLTNECHDLRTLINVTAERNEKYLTDFSDEVQNNYTKIEKVIIRSDNEDGNTSEEYLLLKKEVSNLHESYNCLEEYLKSQNTFNTKINESVSDLYLKVKSIEDEKEANFQQFFDDIEYLTNELSIIKTTNERKVVKFYNKISRHSDKLNKLATIIPEIYGKVNTVKRKIADVKENHVEYEPDEITDLEKEMTNIDREIDSVKTMISNMLASYPSSVFVTVYFEENIGMNMSLSELELFAHQFDSAMATVRQDMTQCFGLQRSSLTKSKRQLMRRPAFTMSDRKRKTGSKKIDEV